MGSDNGNWPSIASLQINMALKIPHPSFFEPTPFAGSILPAVEGAGRQVAGGGLVKELGQLVCAIFIEALAHMELDARNSYGLPKTYQQR